MAKFHECPECGEACEMNLETGVAVCGNDGCRVEEFTLKESPYLVKWTSPHFPPM